MEPRFFLYENNMKYPIMPDFFDVNNKLLTNDEILDPMIQPYDRYGSEVIIKKVSNSEYIVMYAKQPNLQNMGNSVNITNFTNKSNSRNSEEMSRLRKKYRILNKNKVINPFAFRSLLDNDNNMGDTLVFLEKYIIELMNNKLSHANILEFIKLAEYIPGIQLSNPYEVSLIKNSFYMLIADIKKYKKLSAKYMNNSENYFSNITSRLTRVKRKRNWNNRNNGNNGNSGNIRNSQTLKRNKNLS